MCWDEQRSTKASIHMLLFLPGLTFTEVSIDVDTKILSSIDKCMLLKNIPLIPK